MGRDMGSVGRPHSPATPVPCSGPYDLPRRGQAPGLLSPVVRLVSHKASGEVVRPPSMHWWARGPCLQSAPSTLRPLVASHLAPL